MSILIRGMEMPKSCADCRLMADGWCYSVGLEQREKISTVKRPTWCPLVPIPPHGRLIDETWLNMQIRTAKEIHENEKHDFCNAFDSNGHICTEWWCVEDMIENAPTIIPAEEGE